jgi:DNA-binding transcriptional LysR family regulator
LVSCDLRSSSGCSPVLGRPPQSPAALETFLAVIARMFVPISAYGHCRQRTRDISRLVSLALCDSGRLEPTIVPSPSAHTPRVTRNRRRSLCDSGTRSRRFAAQTDWVAGMPRRMATVFSRQMPLVTVKMPAPSLAFRMQLVWHERTRADAGARFFRSLVLVALRPQTPG